MLKLDSIQLNSLEQFLSRMFLTEMSRGFDPCEEKDHNGKKYMAYRYTFKPEACGVFGWAVDCAEVECRIAPFSGREDSDIITLSVRLGYEISALGGHGSNGFRTDLVWCAGKWFTYNEFVAIYQSIVKSHQAIVEKEKK